MRAIEAAIETLGPSAFRDEFWDKEVAFVPSSDESGVELEGLLESISGFLDRTDIRFPSLRLVKDGKELPLEDYTKELRIGPHISQDWIDNERLFQQYRQGATIVLQLLQNSLPDFGRHVNAMEQLFGCNIHASCFVTPPGSQGFTPHYDTYSFFAVQLFGEKKWSLYDSTPLLPIREDRENEAPWTPVPPTKEVTLRPGDVMYVPRGRFHSAFTSTSASVHMTVGLFAVNWIDVIKSSWTTLQVDPRLRASPPNLLDDKDGHSDSVLEIEGVLRDRIDLAAGVKRIRDDVFARHVDTRRGRLLDLLRLSVAEPARACALQPIPYRLEIRNEHVYLQFANKEIRFPGYVYPVLTAICRSEPVFYIDSLPKTLDEESMYFLIRTLTEEGFLGIPRDCA